MSCTVSESVVVTSYGDDDGGDDERVRMHVVYTYVAYVQMTRRQQSRDHYTRWRGLRCARVRPCRDSRYGVGS